MSSPQVQRTGRQHRSPDASRPPLPAGLRRQATAQVFVSERPPPSLFPAQANVTEPLVLAIACNKADMAESRVVSYNTAAQYAASIGALIFETSAKQNTGVPT